MFEGTVPTSTIQGLTSVSELRTTALSDGSGIEVFYKTDVAKYGWYPRPAPAMPCAVWRRLFAHPTSSLNQGIPMSGEAYPVMTPGRKQEWAYIIYYFGGDTQRFTLPCITLPFLHMSVVEVQRRIQNTILQKPKKGLHV